ncbi:hypothetical protein SRABI106_04802 [Rahnella aquatilis]|nr:hypothetical protein SRABI106_04802 [Rahnella aquatilis]
MRLSIAQGTIATYVNPHDEEHDPIYGPRGDTTADATERGRTELAVNKNVIHGNVHQQTDKAEHHAWLGF